MKPTGRISTPTIAPRINFFMFSSLSLSVAALIAIFSCELVDSFAGQRTTCLARCDAKFSSTREVDSRPTVAASAINRAFDSLQSFAENFVHVEQKFKNKFYCRRVDTNIFSVYDDENIFAIRE